MSRKQRSASGRPATRRQLSRRERDRRLRRLMWIAGAVFLILIIAVPGYAAYVEYYLPPRQLLVRVNDTVYDMGYYVKMMRWLQAMAAAQEQEFSLAVIPFELIQTLEENELIRQGAPRVGISVTAEEVSQELRDQLLGPPDPDEEIDEAKLETEFQERYRQLLNAIRFSDAEYRRLVEIDLVRERLREHLGLQVPTVAEQVHLQAILLTGETGEDPEEQAKQIADRLAAGEEFSALAEELSEDEEFREKGGDLGWLPRGIMHEQLDEVAFSLEPGIVSELIVTSQGYFVIKVLEKAEAREIDEEPRESLKDKALADWLIEERKANDVVRSFDSKKYEWAIEQLSQS